MLRRVGALHRGEGGGQEDHLGQAMQAGVCQVEWGEGEQEQSLSCLLPPWTSLLSPQKVGSLGDTLEEPGHQEEATLGPGGDNNKTEERGQGGGLGQAVDDQASPEVRTPGHHHRRHGSRSQRWTGRSLLHAQ